MMFAGVHAQGGTLSSMSCERSVCSSMSISDASLGSEMVVYSLSSCLRLGRWRCSVTRPRKQRSCSRYASCNGQCPDQAAFPDHIMLHHICEYILF